MSGNSVPVFSLRKIRLCGCAGNGVPALAQNFTTPGTVFGNAGNELLQKIEIGLGVGFAVSVGNKLLLSANRYESSSSRFRRSTPLTGCI